MLPIENIHAANCHVAAAYFAGLPESKIAKLEMKNCQISFAAEARSGVPIMSNGVLACSKLGIHAENVSELILDHVSVEGQCGEPFLLSGVDKFIQNED